MSGPERPRLDGQRVLITGGLGFIGSNLAHHCLELGARVTIYDCLDPRSGGNMHNIAAIREHVELVLHDIRSFEGVSAAVVGKTLLFNCAAYTSHPQSMKDPFIDVEVNCRGTLNLLDAARRFSRDMTFVHVGTSTQIGRMLVKPVDERHPEFPIDIYSANKTASEKYVLIYGNAYGMPTTVVRFANVYGPRSNISNSDFGFVNFFVGLALRGRDITVYGDGAQLRNLSYVDDCVDALVAAATSPASRGEVFFAVADRQHSVVEIAQQIVEHVGGRVRFVEWPRERAAVEVGDAVISNAKIKQTLGWTPTIDLATGLEKTRQYFADCLDHYL